MKSILKVTITIVTILAGVATVLGLYLQWESKTPEIDIKSISIENLTNLPQIDGFNANYVFKGDTVRSFLITKYLIENTGNDIIIGKGNNKTLIPDSLSIQIGNEHHLLSYEIKNQTFPFESSINSQNSNRIQLSFLQWRPDELFEITLYLEAINKNLVEPSVYINEREVINSEVTYSTLTSSSSQLRPLSEFIPKIFKKILWWIGLICFGGILIIIPIVYINELMKVKKFNKWKTRFMSTYTNWMNDRIDKNTLRKSFEPENLPAHHWKDFPEIKPDIPSNYGSMGNFLLGAIVVELICSIPILWMIHI